MKNLIFFFLCFLSFPSFSQLNPFHFQEYPPSFTIHKQSPSIITTKAYNVFIKKKIDYKKATIDDWEKVLKEVGKVTKSENTIICTISPKNYATLTFEKKLLSQMCETYDDGEPDTKEDH